eukprot:3475379-Alexandrium_andersonii.AAC.1
MCIRDRLMRLPSRSALCLMVSLCPVAATTPSHSTSAEDAEEPRGALMTSRYATVVSCTSLVAPSAQLAKTG